LFKSKEGKEINTHQSFISAQFSSFGEPRILSGKHPKHPNFRQLDSPFNQTSPNRDSNQAPHYDFIHIIRVGLIREQVKSLHPLGWRSIFSLRDYGEQYTIRQEKDQEISIV